MKRDRLQRGKLFAKQVTLMISPLESKVTSRRRRGPCRFMKASYSAAVPLNLLDDEDDEDDETTTDSGSGPVTRAMMFVGCDDDGDDDEGNDEEEEAVVDDTAGEDEDEETVAAAAEAVAGLAAALAAVVDDIDDVKVTEATETAAAAAAVVGSVTPGGLDRPVGFAAAVDDNIDDDTNDDDDEVVFEDRPRGVGPDATGAPIRGLAAAEAEVEDVKAEPVLPPTAAEELDRALPVEDAELIVGLDGAAVALTAVDVMVRLVVRASC